MVVLKASLQYMTAVCVLMNSKNLLMRAMRWTEVRLIRQCACAGNIMTCFVGFSLPLNYTYTEADLITRICKIHT
jgi:hypothetical protein